MSDLEEALERAAERGIPQGDLDQVREFAAFLRDWYDEHSRDARV